MTHQISWKIVQKGIKKASFRPKNESNNRASRGIIKMVCDCFGFEPARRKTNFPISSAQNDRSLVSVSRTPPPIGTDWTRPELVVDTYLTHQNQCVRHTASGTFLGNYFFTEKTATL